jgi:hypothetical protein
MSIELLYFCTGIQDKNIPWKKDMKQFEAWKGTDLTFFSIYFLQFLLYSHAYSKWIYINQKHQKLIYPTELTLLFCCCFFVCLLLFFFNSFVPLLFCIVVLTEGRTGVPYVDANMRELSATGFMSNRGRQNVASFLTKDLHLDWRLGAEWFESQLVCAAFDFMLKTCMMGNPKS